MDDLCIFLIAVKAGVVVVFLCPTTVCYLVCAITREGFESEAGRASVFVWILLVTNSSDCFFNSGA